MERKETKMARIYVADNKYESGIIKVYRVDSKYDADILFYKVDSKYDTQWQTNNDFVTRLG